MAQSLFEQAAAAEDAEDWTRCERVLNQAIALVETPGLKFHLAYCKEQQSRWVEALEDYRAVERMLHNGVDAPDVEELIGPAIARLERDIPTLRLKFKAPPPSSTLFLDGEEKPLSLVGADIPIDPGARTVTVSSPGHEAFATKFNLLPREVREVEIVLVALQEASPQKTEQQEVSSTSVDADTAGYPVKGYVLISEALLSAAGLGVGAVSMARVADAEDRHKQAFEALGSDSGCLNVDARRQMVCDELDRLAREAELFRGWQTAGFVTAGVGAVAFVVTWLAWPEPESSQNHASQGIRSFELNVTPRQWYATLGGQF